MKTNQITSTILIGIILLITSMVQAETSQPLLKIILIRHARVDQKIPAICSANRANKLHEAYNQLPVYSFQTEEVRKHIPEQQQLIFSSTMNRARQTAIQLFPEADTLVTNPLFNEYALPMVSIPIIPLPYPAWTYLSRMFWLFRINDERESYSQGIIRAKRASLELEKLAMQRKTVVVVCHGYIIRDIRRQLQKKGWHLTVFNGNKNLAVSELTRQSSE